MSLSSNMGDHGKIFEYHDESQTEKLARKSKQSPFFPIAIAGCVSAVAFGAYKFKQRGQMSPSVFLMQLRVGAQGVAVGALAVGVLYSMYDHWKHPEHK